MAGLSGRRVWLTGHTGFKGSWLAACLLDEGAEVHGYALEPPTEPALFDAIGLRRRLHHVHGDVRDREAVASACAAADPDVVFHLAAQAIVRASYAEPVETFDANVMGTVHVLDAVRRRGKPCAVVVVTSDKCYEEHGNPRPHREDDPMGGHDPYAASKGAAELVVAAWRRSFFPAERFGEHGVAVATARAGNVIGGGDWARDRIVPDIVRALFAGKPVALRNPLAIRPWQHVLDALSGYRALALAMLGPEGASFGEGWNFGPAADDRVNVRDLTERVLARWGTGAWELAADAQAPREAPFLALDATKATARLAWRPRWRAAEAVDATVAWYAAARDGKDLAAFTSHQIGEHGGMLG